jgi:hypothetical protein
MGFLKKYDPIGSKGFEWARLDKGLASLSGQNKKIRASEAAAAAAEKVAAEQQAATKQAAEATTQSAIDAAAAMAQQQSSMIARDNAQRAATEALTVDMGAADVSLNPVASSSAKRKNRRVQWGSGQSSVSV